MNIEELMEEIYRYAGEKGYHFTWKEAPKALMLIVTEASEAMESWRDDDKENYEIELADIVIRVLQMVAELGFKDSFVKAIRKKMDKNWTRPYHHGRKVI